MKFPTFEEGRDFLTAKGYRFSEAGPRGGLVYADGICLHLAALGSEGELNFSD
jgi:hypothetical protein